MIAGALEIQLMAGVARLQSDMDAANKTVSSAMGKIDSIVGTTTKVLGALGIGLSVNYFGKLIQGSIDAQDNLKDMSQKVGVSIESLAGLEFAAGQSGTSLDAVQKGLKSVSTQLYDADKGLAASQENFDALGINVRGATGELKNADSVMIEVADQFASMRDGTEKTALAVKLFGKAGLDLIPMLNEGSDAIAGMVAEGQRLNPVTTESARQADIYNDNIDRLTKTASSFGVVLVNSMLPSLSSVSEEMVEFTRNGEMDKWLGRIGTTAEGLAIILAARLVPALSLSAAGFIASTYQSIAYQAALARMAGVSGVAAAATAGLNGALTLVGGPIGALVLVAGGLALMISKMETAQESTARLREEMDGLNRDELERGIRLQQAYVTGLEFQIKKLQAQGTAHIAARNRLAELNLELESGKNALQELAKGMKGVEDREFDKLIDDMTEGNEHYARATKSAATQTKELGKAADNTADALVDTRTNTKFLNDLYTKLGGNISLTADAYVDMMGVSSSATNAVVRDVQDLDAALNLIPSGFADIETASGRASTKADDDWREFSSSFGDHFADMMMDSDSFWEGLEKSAIRTFYKIMGEFVLSGLAGMMSGKGAGGFNLANTSMSLLGGGGGGYGSLISAGASALGIGGGAAASTAGYTAITAAQAAALNLGATGAAAGVATGTAAAGGGIMAGASSALASIPVYGWVAMAALAAYKIFAKEETPSHNAGLLLHDVAGAKANQKFDVDAFASGLDPVGFMRDTTKQQATEIIDIFRALDQNVVDVARMAGLSVSANASTFSGLDERGLGSGVFLGSAGEEGKPGKSLDQQLDQYTKQLIATLSGQLDGAVLSSILSSGNAQQMIEALQAQTSGIDGSHANGIDYVPFDGYRAELHKGERVQTSSEVVDMGAALRQMAAAIDRLQYSAERTAENTQRAKEILTRVTRDGESLLTEAA